MREIKFRIFFDNQMIQWNQYGKEFYLAPTAGAPCVVFYRDRSCEPHFIPEGRLKAVMQFTGLKDKNGKEIYEGDVFRFEQWHGGVEHAMIEKSMNDRGETPDWFNNNVILWHSDSAQWIQRDTNDITDMTYSGNSLNVSLVKSSEVISNIYENPELLNS